MKEEPSLSVQALLIDRNPPRGLLVEISYPEHHVDKIMNFIEKLDSIEKKVGKIVVIKLGDSWEEQLACPHRVSNEELFLRRLERMWQDIARVHTLLKEGTTVILDGYAHSLCSFGYLMNCFGVRKHKDQVAALTLASYLKGLIQPDVILCIVDTPQTIDSEFKRVFEKVKTEQDEAFNVHEEVVNSVMFRMEDAKDVFNRYFDNVRPISPDNASLNIHGQYAIAAEYMQKRIEELKIY